MQYANPLYDHAFKYLMLNNKLAKKALSTILGKKVKSLVLEQQEIVLESNILGFDVFRLDFKATIVHEDGRQERVLIELQKSKKTGDLERFRKYISTSYAQSSSEVDEDEQALMNPLPVILVYIFGFDLPEIESMAVKIGKKVVDLSSHQQLDIQSDFIDAVTHDCIILQVKRVPPEPKTLIEQFLSLFDQSNVTPEKRYILEVDETKIPNPFMDMVTHLKKPLLDKEYQRKLELEQELDNILLQQIRKVEQANDKLEAVSRKAEAAELKLEEAIRMREEEIRMKEEERRMKEEEQKLKEEAILKAKAANAILQTVIHGLRQQGLASSAIIALLNISPEQLDAIEGNEI
jgi:hypothetical protein